MAFPSLVQTGVNGPELGTYLDSDVNMSFKLDSLLKLMSGLSLKIFLGCFV